MAAKRISKKHQGIKTTTGYIIQFTGKKDKKIC